MHLARCAALLLLALLHAPAAGAQPLTSRSGPPASEPQGPGRLEVWVEPLWGITYATWTTAVPSDLPTVYYLPVGATWRVAPEARAWSAELVVFAVVDHASTDDDRGLRLSAGPVFGAGPGEGGFFAQPLGTLFLTARRTGVSAYDDSGLGLEAGVDVGYRFQWGGFSLTPVLGVGLGVGLGMAQQRETGDEGPGSRVRPSIDVATTGAKGGTALLWNVNLDLLRLGWTF